MSISTESPAGDIKNILGVIEPLTAIFLLQRCHIAAVVNGKSTGLSRVMVFVATFNTFA